MKKKKKGKEKEEKEGKIKTFHLLLLHAFNERWTIYVEYFDGAAYKLPSTG